MQHNIREPDYLRHWYSVWGNCGSQMLLLQQLHNQECKLMQQQLGSYGQSTPPIQKWTFPSSAIFSHPPNIISYGIPRSPLRILANRIVGSFFGGSKLYNIIWLKSPINYPKLSHFKIACRTHIEENKIYWKRQAMKRWPNYWKSWRPHGTGDITCQEPSTILCIHTSMSRWVIPRFCFFYVGEGDREGGLLCSSNTTAHAI